MHEVGKGMCACVCFFYNVFSFVFFAILGTNDMEGLLRSVTTLPGGKKALHDIICMHII